MNTSLISYYLDANIIIIKDAKPSYLIPIIFSGIVIAIRACDLAIITRNKKDFDFIRNKMNEIKLQIQMRYSSLKDLNLRILYAIGGQEEGVSLTQIKRFFQKEKLPIATKSGKKLSKQYLNKLVSEFYLAKEIRDDRVEIYRLAQRGIHILDELNKLSNHK